MFTQLSDYVKNNQQEIIIYVILSLLAILFIVGFVIWINKYLYRKHHDLGCRCFESLEFDTAIQEFDIARKLAKRPLSGKKADMENTSALLAQACIASSRWEEAIDALMECARISPAKAEYHLSLVENYLRTGEYPLARESLDKAFALVSSDAVEALREENLYAITRNSKDKEVMERLTWLKNSLAVSESEELDKLEILKPDFEGREFILEGLADSEQDDLNLAKFYIRQYLLEKNEAIGKESGRESAKSETREQVSYLTKAGGALARLEATAESAEFYNALAFLAIQGGDSKRAEENYEKAIEYEPQYAETYYNLALLCLDAFNDTERAISNFENAIERNPELAKAHHNLALLFLGSGRSMEEVKHHFQKAIRINPLFSEVYWDLALILARKDFKEFLLG
uniref:Tetratricopeptide repeat-containing protein n=1 Tax=Candidatus Kentrum sp. MB TaxID=2138164 RepID=A0A450XAN2_9GAMM|nr:MAG: Tetratricopeptide repeat-containing protein [Candidatus Kentron sp. MB]VFK35628.1 MAG: Tetratricopeptide repeat-containing protein [Candidatus Kentron sp. MB]VFK77486.1 MAG: Tetratricopeptide repeat-containing protein [Candidatus Kentron sp. MB]